jgi:hypothetical protein
MTHVSEYKRSSCEFLTWEFLPSLAAILHVLLLQENRPALGRSRVNSLQMTESTKACFAEQVSIPFFPPCSIVIRAAIHQY